MNYNYNQRNNMNRGNMNRNNMNQSSMNQNNTQLSNPNSEEGFADNPKLRNVDPMKLKIIMEIKEQSRHKSLEELLPDIMKINQELNRRNMNFTKAETEILLEAIEESLSPAERQKFNMIKGFM